MPDCEQIVLMLSEYIDRDLPPETCSVIQSHLATCRACGEAEASLRRTIEMCRSFRSDSRPGPLAPEKHDELKAAFQKVLADLQDKRVPSEANPKIGH
jgi:anti-sigma factor RsiW